MKIKNMDELIHTCTMYIHVYNIHCIRINIHVGACDVHLNVHLHIHVVSKIEYKVHV